MRALLNCGMMPPHNRRWHERIESVEPLACPSARLMILPLAQGPSRLGLFLFLILARSRSAKKPHSRSHLCSTPMRFFWCRQQERNSAAQHDNGPRYVETMRSSELASSLNLPSNGDWKGDPYSRAPASHPSSHPVPVARGMPLWIPRPDLISRLFVCPRFAEMMHIRNSLPDEVVVQRVDERLSALGNCIACNDYVALIHPDMDKVGARKTVVVGPRPSSEHCGVVNFSRELPFCDGGLWGASPGGVLNSCIPRCAVSNRRSDHVKQVLAGVFKWLCGIPAHVGSPASLAQQNCWVTGAGKCIENKKPY